MGALSDLVSQTFGNTSDVDTGTLPSLAVVQPDFSNQTAQMSRDIVNNKSSLRRAPATLQQPLGVNALPETYVPGGTVATSDMYAKQNISKASAELDKILSNVYMRLNKGNKNV